MERINHDARTGAESLRLREQYKEDPTPAALTELKDKGYHPVDLFTDKFPIPGCCIYSAIAPDLLHQASKNFHDQVFIKWCKAISKSMGVTEKALDAELDARFQHIPAYQGLRWFNNGRNSMLNPTEGIMPIQQKMVERRSDGKTQRSK